MLWVNLIMDSLASLSLATDSPTDDMLDLPPYSGALMCCTTLGPATLRGAFTVHMWGKPLAVLAHDPSPAAHNAPVCTLQQLERLLAVAYDTR